MTVKLRALSLPALAVMLAVGSWPTTGLAMEMISDEELALCLEQASAITFEEAMKAATEACHHLHTGEMGTDAMGTDAMAPDAMGTDAMAPKQ